MKVLLIIFSFILLLPNFLPVDINGADRFNGDERYSPNLAHLNTIPKLEAYADSLSATKKVRKGSRRYWVSVDSIISERFYHGFSRYNLNENWLAAVADRVFGYGLSNKVYVSDIMKSREAGCSQQAAIMMELAGRQAFNYRSVGFPHHYAVQIGIGLQWYFFDADMEPSLTIQDRKFSSWNGKNDELKKYYLCKTPAVLDYEFGIHQKANFGTPNVSPAPHLKSFHSVTFLLSRILWLFPLLGILLVQRRKFFFVKVVSPNQLPEPVFSLGLSI